MVTAQLGEVGGDSTHLSACWLPRDKAARDGLRRKALSQIVAAEA